MATQVEELKLVITMTDNASAQVQALRQQYQQLGSGQTEGHVERFKRGHSELGKQIKELGHIAEGGERAMLGFVGKMGLVGAGIAAVGAAVYASLASLKEFSNKIVDINNKARVIGVHPAVLKSIEDQLQRIGVGADVADQNVARFNEAYAKIGRQGSQEHMKLVREAGHYGAEMEKGIQSILSQNGTIAKINETLAQAQNVYNNRLKETGGNIEDATEFVKHYLEQWGLDPTFALVKRLQDVSQEQMHHMEQMAKNTAEYHKAVSDLSREWDEWMDEIKTSALSPDGLIVKGIQKMIGLTHELHELWKHWPELVKQAQEGTAKAEIDYWTKQQPQVTAPGGGAAGEIEFWTGQKQKNLADKLGLGSIPGGPSGPAGPATQAAHFLETGDVGEKGKENRELMKGNTEQLKKLNDYLATFQQGGGGAAGPGPGGGGGARGGGPGGGAFAAPAGGGGDGGGGGGGGGGEGGGGGGGEGGGGGGGGAAAGGIGGAIQQMMGGGGGGIGGAIQQMMGGGGGGGGGGMLGGLLGGGGGGIGGLLGGLFGGRGMGGRVMRGLGGLPGFGGGGGGGRRRGGGGGGGDEGAAPETPATAPGAAADEGRALEFKHGLSTFGSAPSGTMEDQALSGQFKDAKASGTLGQTPPAATGDATSGSEYLRNMRKPLVDEVNNNPETKRKLAAVLSMESPAGGPAVVESLYNRTTALNEARAKRGLPPKTIGQMLGSSGHSFYGPVKHDAWQRRANELDKDPARRAQLDKLIDQAAGSNVIKGATDQGSGSDPNVKWSGGKIVIAGETYNDWGGGLGHEGNRQFRERLMAGVKSAEEAGKDRTTVDKTSIKTVKVDAAGSVKVNIGGTQDATLGSQGLFKATPVERQTQMKSADSGPKAEAPKKSESHAEEAGPG